MVFCLLAVMAISGLLAVLSNSVVIYVGLWVKKDLFEPAILSLAFADLLTGLVCTPIVCVIYYYSEHGQCNSS